MTVVFKAGLTVAKDNPGNEPALLARLIDDSDVAVVDGSIFLSLVQGVPATATKERQQRL